RLIEEGSINKGWADFQTAISAAQAVIDNSSATSVEIHDAFVAVYNAYFALEVSTNKTELAALIAAVNDTLENTSEGQWKGQYPAGSKDVLRAVLVPAEDINKDRLATEEGVAGAYNNLKEAYDLYLSQVS